jgi:predicted amidohydrolase YtcJ
VGVDTIIKSAHILTMEEACESRGAAQCGVGVLPEAIGPMGPLIGIGQLAGHPEEARHLSPYEALVLYTRNAAWAAFEERDKGTLAVGKLADLVVLGDNPLTAPASEIAGIPVELTLVGGHIRHER